MTEPQEELEALRRLSGLTAIFASSLRVEDGLKLILQGIREQLGFDRVRLYLVDPEKETLRGELSVDSRGRIESLRSEEIPLKPGAQGPAGILLGETNGSPPEPLKPELGVPLVVQGQPTGLVIVDNSLSQRAIGDLEGRILKSFAGQIALAVDNSRLFREVQRLSLHDSLTHLPLRRFFDERFKEELYRADRHKSPLSLALLDIDYFKVVNDTYGHQTGDRVLKEVAQVILKGLRQIDFPARYGGDEMVLLFPEAGGETAKGAATRLAQDIRQLKIPAKFSKAGVVQVTPSIGIATYPHDARTSKELLHRADEALYWVKSRGKNGIALYQEIRKGTKGARPRK